jgi:uncharacterized membrane protein
MTDPGFPVGWRHNPSSWHVRGPAIALALTGCGIATYLALYQIGLIAQVWEPFFGGGSRVILKESAIAQSLPVPDAALGAVVYLLEAVVECVGGNKRWQTWPAAVFVTGIVALGLVLAAVVLVASQVLWFQAFCTLCLASAACSLAIAALVAPEVWAGARYSREFGRRPAAPGSPGS